MAIRPPLFSGVSRAGRVRRVAAVALVTAMTVGMGTSLIFMAVVAASSGPLVATIAATVALSAPFGAGAAWGWGLARLGGAATKPMTKTGALAFGGTTLALAVPIDLTQLWLDDLPGWMPYGMHGYFTIVFMLGIGVIAGLASARMARRLGVADYRRVGVGAGLWAGLGFLPGSALGYLAGFPINGIRFNMVWSIVIAAPVAALIGGLGLGLLLENRLERSELSQPSGRPGSTTFASP